MRPCARYVRRRCFCAWLTWMCEMNSVSTSRPFTCAGAAADSSAANKRGRHFSGPRAPREPVAQASIGMKRCESRRLRLPF